MREEELPEFGGETFALGKAHGARFATQIAWLLEWYRDQWWEMTEQEIQSAIQGYKRAVHRWAPHLEAEIAGIATGAGVSADMILALNARTELRADVDVLECTSVGVCGEVMESGEVVLAQNWDWWNQLRGRSEVVRLRPSGAAPMIALIEPGMVGKIGMNASGVGVCLNFLATPQVNERAVPVHILCRMLAECTSVAACISLLQRIPRAANANYLVGDASGAVASIEAMVDGVHATHAEGVITHTNVALCQDGWCMRQSIFERRLSMFRHPLRVEMLKTALRHPGVEAPPDDEAAVETLRSVVMCLESRHFEVSDGCRAVDDGYVTYTLLGECKT